MQPNLAPCSAFAAHRFAPAAALRSALLLLRIASRLRQLRALLCFCRTSLRACGSSAFCSASPRIASRLRQQASGAVRPFGAIPPTSLRSRAPPAHGAAGGYAVRRLAAIRRFRSRISPTSFLREKTCSFARIAARFHFFAGESSPFARNASRTLLPDQPVSPSLRQLACNVS
jgi:hypothetical protein